MSLLAIDRLSVHYEGTAALRDVSLNVNAGQIVALVGESGSGKSTLALAAMALLPRGATMAGTIGVNGMRLDGLAPKALDRLRGGTISMVFQEPMTALTPHMRIGAQVAEAIRLHQPMTRRAAASRAAELLVRVGLLADVVPPSRYPHQLSGGQRQRVAIAIAIAAGPALLIADEPTTALDVTTQAHVMALLRRLVAEDNMGLLLVSHDLAVVAEFADHIVVMKDGAIVEQGTPADILLQPRAAYTRKLVECSRHAPVRPAPPSGVPLLEVHDILRSYPVERRTWRPSPDRVAVNRVSFTVGRGETVGLVGESGSGKTTLLRTILALDAPQHGEVLLGGQSITRARGAALRRLRRGVQAVFQDPAASFDPRHRVRRIVAEPLSLLDQPIGQGDRHARVVQMLAQVGLSEEIADRFPHELSGGQRQRVALARALIVEPALIILDEAVSALDVSIRADILDLLADLSRRLGVAYLFVSHDLAMMRNVADHLVVLKDGYIVEQGPTAAILASPSHPYTAALLAATPDLDRALAARFPQA